MIVLLFTAVLFPVFHNPQRDQVIDGKLAAVVVDMQPIYMCGITDKEKKREIPKILKTLDFCHENDIPIFVLEITDGGDTIERIKTRLDEYGAVYIGKDGNSGFEGTGFECSLRALGIKNLLLTGVNASICVRETAQDALNFGFGICTSKDIIAEPPVWHRGYKTYESIPWFTRNGVYCDHYTDLLHVIERSLREHAALDDSYVGPIAGQPEKIPSRGA